jgi:hypothetical protein
MDIRLLINNTTIILPRDFEITYILNNPELVEREENKTYPFSIPLEANRQVFGFLDRNTCINIDNEYTAELYISSFKLISGKVIITSINSDNIELYISSDNQRFWGKNKNVYLNDIDLGYEWFDIKLDGYNEEIFTSAITGGEHFIISPITKRTTVNELNQWSLYNTWSFKEQQFQGPVCLFPRLSYILKQIFIALGYRITRNDIDDLNYLKDIIILHSKVLSRSNNTYYKDMMPKVSIVDFLCDIERKFNIAFLVNDRNKTVIIKTGLNTETKVKDCTEVLDGIFNNYIDPIGYIFTDATISDSFLDTISSDLKYSFNPTYEDTETFNSISTTAGFTEVERVISLDGHDLPNFNVKYEQLVLESENLENTEIRYAIYQGLIGRECSGEVASGKGKIPISLPLKWTGNKGLFSKYHSQKVNTLSKVKLETSIRLKPRLFYLNDLLSFFSEILISNSQKYVAKSQEIIITGGGIKEHTIKCFPL